MEMEWNPSRMKTWWFWFYVNSPQGLSQAAPILRQSHTAIKIVPLKKRPRGQFVPFKI